MAKPRLSLSGLVGLAANFRGFQKELNQEIKKRTARSGRDVVRLARQLVPKDTRRTMRAISYRITPSGLVLDVYVDPEPYATDGVTYYAPYVEHGTSISAAQPFLFPAWEAIRPHYERDIKDALRTVVVRRTIR